MSSPQVAGAECKKDNAIRWLIRRDMPEVLDIERESFATPWDEETFCHCLREKSTIGMVIEEGDVNPLTIGFMIYELHPDHIKLINIAVHPHYRKHKVGQQLIRRLQDKITPDRRSFIEVLLPESCVDTLPFFERFGLAIRTTEEKGKITYKPLFSAMTLQDAEAVQVIEDRIFKEHPTREPRHIAGLLTHHTYGIIARDANTSGIMGYILYERDEQCITLDGEIGVVVNVSCRDQGIDFELVKELIKQGLPFLIRDIPLSNRSQCDFWKSFGVTIPEPVMVATVEWKPDIPT